MLRATSDPARRFGTPDRTDDLALSFGPGWTTSSWSTPQAAAVHQLHHHGTPVGWAAPLADGLWGSGGWIAVPHLADGRAELLLAGLGRPLTHRDRSEALDALRSARLTPPATATRTPDSVRPAPRTSGWIGPRAAEPGLVTVPRDPVLRGLPDNDAHRPLDPAVFGDYWQLLGLGHAAGRVAGEGGGPYGGLGRARRRRPGPVGRGVRGLLPRRPRHPGTDPARHPEQAAHTVMKAYLQQV
ncbi:hypothetical protein ACFWOG_25370 [Kitasatospora sp. NPDC058406]|uniref:hypothetical protein n=1 Tax=Kitasatospora sp. NPDC058406 TaxID=3346483 RepID=UPI00364A462D